MLADNLAKVQTTIKEALAKRTELKATGSTVTIVAVTKNHPAEIVTETLAAGLNNVGENRVQEAQHKKAVLPEGGIWHLIGHLQKNKAKHAVELFDIIESVDSEEILGRIDKLAEESNKVQDVLLQINEAREPQKTGLTPEGFVTLAGKLSAFTHVRVRGVMVIAQAAENVEETRPAFAAGYKDFLLLQKAVGKDTCNILSMGMTHDYWIAVEEGANEVRVGTALFGARDYSQKF